MKKVIVLLFVLMFTLTGVAFAVADKTATRADFEEFCKILEGRFIGDLVWSANWVGYGKKAGDKVTGYYIGRTMADGNAHIGVFYAGIGMMTRITYYDAGAKQIKSARADSGGSVSNEVCFKMEGKWHMSSTGSLADGRKTEAINTLITISDDGNTLTWSGASTVDGEKSVPSEETWHRVSR